jgi:uncharacterized protein
MTAPDQAAHAPAIAEALGLSVRGVGTALRLFADKATVPFIARYRKEVTGGLDEVQLRQIEEAHERFERLSKRRAAVLAGIEEQGALTAELRLRIETCASLVLLEDLYLPFKKKRKTRASVAREKGLEPLARLIWTQPRHTTSHEAARPFVRGDKGVPDVQAALAGARDIVAERFAEDAVVRARSREAVTDRGQISSTRSKKVTGRTQFEQYYDHRESIRRIPSHRYLAMARGEAEEALRIKIEVDGDGLVGRALGYLGHDPRCGLGDQLREAVEDGYKRLLAPSLTNDVRGELKTRSGETAIEVFAQNLRALLLAAPLGPYAVIGIDPGIRTGCKVAVVRATGSLAEHTVIFPGRGGRQADEAGATLRRLCERHRPRAVAVGNGTGGRETLAFVNETLQAHGGGETFAVSVNEAGASVYSASDVAREEFPNLDLTVRGAISIARRLQDPLAELVKIDPKSIGVGQYQHDVEQGRLQRKLAEVVESCVNLVGVDLNTASAPLLGFVSGIGPNLAKKVVAHRESGGRFTSRRGLLDVPGLGRRTFEQAAGFLRVLDGTNPLDASAVHPERYALVRRMAKDLGVHVGELAGDPALVARLEISRYVDDTVGIPTVRDIVDELKKPGRDPREEFAPPAFRDDVREITDLEVGMVLEGVVTNVTHFGAFVDLGVHEDGLVHISQLADRFVSDPHEFVGPGDALRVMVVSVDLDRKRISLTARDLPQTP